jgi:hypothetical protein
MKIRLLACFFICSSFFSYSQETAHPLLAATRDIKSRELMGYVEELAGPAYQGRLTGSPGYRKAAEFVADRFTQWGLAPACKGEWFQYFNQPYSFPLPGCTLTMGSGVQMLSYHYYDEFMPGATTSTGKVTAEVLFAGYGITAPELGYDDYAGIDAKGKIVLICPEAPLSPAVGAEKFLPWLDYSTHQYKMANAIKHGVAGVLYFYGPLANTNNDYHENLLITMIGSKVAADLFAGTGKNFQTVVAGISKELKPASFPTGKSMTIENYSEYHPEGIGMNVIGMLPGTDSLLKDEIILIGGHLDHCGMCYEMCPGAFDNASGVSVILGVAKALSQSGLKFKRTLVFMAIGAEEQGLIGSNKYVENPSFPLAKTIGFINLDCVGVGPSFHAGGGVSFPALFGAVESANRKYVHREMGSSPVGYSGRPRSDAAVFIKAGVPAISISSFGGSYGYHTPADTPATIWEETMEDLATILTLACADLAEIDLP